MHDGAKRDRADNMGAIYDKLCRKGQSGTGADVARTENGLSEKIIAGADLARGRWVVARRALGGDGPVTIGMADTVAELLDDPLMFVLAIDMPIGLPDAIDGPGRAAEQAARPLLGARQSSVFSIPSRAAVSAPDYGAACALALATSQPPRKISKQGFMLFPKIREIDALLLARPEWVARVRECHPEVAFWRMNGESPLAHAKKIKGRINPTGMAERTALLAASGIPRAALETVPPRGAGMDDVLDALACLVTAGRIARGEAVSFPSPPDRDSQGLPIAIWA